MRYYKVMDENGYLVSIGKGNGNEEIIQEEYETILSVINSRPTAEPGYTYKLRADLTWESVEVPIVKTDEDLLADEALDIILGGLT